MLRVGRGRRSGLVGRAGAGVRCGAAVDDDHDPATEELLQEAETDVQGEQEAEAAERREVAEPPLAAAVVAGSGLGRFEAELLEDVRTDALEHRQRDLIDAVADPDLVLAGVVHLDGAVVQEDAGLVVLQSTVVLDLQGQLEADGGADRGGGVVFRAEAVLVGVLDDDEAGARGDLSVMLLASDHGTGCPFWDMDGAGRVSFHWLLLKIPNGFRTKSVSNSAEASTSRGLELILTVAVCNKSSSLLVKRPQTLIVRVYSVNSSVAC